MFEILAIFLAFTATTLLYLTNKYQFITQTPVAKKHRKWAYALVLVSFLSLLLVMSTVASIFSLLVVLMLIAAVLPFCALLVKGASK